MKESWRLLPWHEDLWQSLMGQERSDRLAHAYLLRGVPGVGKFQFAKALAAQLLCEDADGKPACGHCKECELIKAGTHPDLMLVEPEAPGKPIKIDQVRKVNEFARKTAQQGGRRVVVINPAEAMNISAANALLKSLEEPGSNTVFLLASARVGDMLPTIRSRCQLLSFSIPAEAAAVQWLSEHIADHQVLDQLLVLAGGAPVSARDMFDNGALELRGKLINAMAGLFRGDITSVELAKEWQSADLPQLLGWLSSWLDDVVKMALLADETSIRNRDLVKMLSYVSGKSPVAAVVRLRDETLEQRQLILGGANLNVQMMLEGVFSRYLELVI